MRLGKVDMQDD